jgi:hypothetical protein
MIHHSKHHSTYTTGTTVPGVALMPTCSSVNILGLPKIDLMPSHPCYTKFTQSACNADIVTSKPDAAEILP